MAISYDKKACNTGGCDTGCDTKAPGLAAANPMLGSGANSGDCPATTAEYLQARYDNGDFTEDGIGALLRAQAKGGITFALLCDLWQSGDITNPGTFAILSGGKQAPDEGGITMSDWMDSPAIAAVTVSSGTALVQQVVALSTYSPSARQKDLRPIVKIEWAPNITSDSSTFSVDDTGMSGDDVRFVVDLGVLTGTASASNKRTWVFGGNATRLYTVTTAAIAAAKFRYRYVVRWERVTN